MKAQKIYKSTNPSEELVKIKHNGKIFTPDYLVKIILDQGHYIFGNINKKNVIDNSCGDGQFLIHIVDRYCIDFLKKSNDTSKLKKELEQYIHGIEIEKKELDICRERCSKVAEKYGIRNVNWDFMNCDTLKTTKFDSKMDFVLGNPPYVRVHNLNDDFDIVKSYKFSNGGMTDLFIAFYEKSIKMLNKTGIISYITPSSFFTSIAGTKMRDYFNNNLLLESICDLKHFQPFNAITYTTIVCLNKTHKKDMIKYYEFDELELKPKFISDLKQEQYVINEKYYFSTPNNINLLKKILSCTTKTDIEVKNGFATLADKIFIGDFKENSNLIIPVVKASRAKWSKIIYPYDKSGKVLLEDEIKKDKKVYSYLLKHKEELENRSIDNKKYWYSYGRSQAIKDTYKERICINSLITATSKLKIVHLKPGEGIYSGLYIMSKTIPKETIKKALLDNDFNIFVSLLGKYKNGGCYTFSSKDIKCYLDYKIGGEINNDNK